MVFNPCHCVSSDKAGRGLKSASSSSVPGVATPRIHLDNERNRGFAEICAWAFNPDLESNAVSVHAVKRQSGANTVGLRLGKMHAIPRPAAYQGCPDDVVPPQVMRRPELLNRGLQSFRLYRIQQRVK